MPMSDIATLYFLVALSFFGIVAVPVYHYVRKGRRDLFEPVYLATLAFFMLFWVRSVYVLIWGSTYLGERPFASDIVESWNVAWLYLLLACGAFYVGYYSNLGLAVAKIFAPLPAKWHGRRAGWVIVIILAVGLGAFYLLVGRYGGFENFLDRRRSPEVLGLGEVDQLRYCICLSMQAAYAVMLSRRKGLGLFILLLLITLGSSLASGSRITLLFPLLGLLMIHHYLKKPLKFRHLVGLVLLFALILSPIMIVLRESPSSARTSFWEQLRNQEAVSGFLERFSGMDGLVYIIRDTPKVMDYQYGKTFAFALVAWIPRRFWKDKPLDFVHVFTPLYLGRWFRPESTAFGPTILGEAYVNFHVAGILLVAGVGGIFLRALYHYLIKRSPGISGVFVYSAILPFIIICLESQCVGLLTPAWIFLLTCGSSLFASAKRLQ
jgi:oligosaccharide repeat unit polymerase